MVPRKRKLNRAAQEADGLLWAPEVDQHLGDTTCGEAEVQEGEIGGEKVHWHITTEKLLSSPVLPGQILSRSEETLNVMENR